MRNAVMIAAIVLLCCPAFAADHWRVSILAAEIANEGNDPWSQDPHAGISVGIAYAPTPQWDAELTVASQTHRSPYTRLFYATAGNAPGQFYPVTEFREYRVMPVDVSVTRHFAVAQRISPYVRAGVRYVEAPGDSPSVELVTVGTPPAVTAFPLGFRLRDRVSGQAGAGVRVQVTPRTAIRGEATRLLRSDAADFDPLTRYALGVSWMF